MKKSFLKKQVSNVTCHPFAWDSKHTRGTGAKKKVKEQLDNANSFYYHSYGSYGT